MIDRAKVLEWAPLCARGRRVGLQSAYELVACPMCCGGRSRFREKFSKEQLISITPLAQEENDEVKSLCDLVCSIRQKSFYLRVLRSVLLLITSRRFPADGTARWRLVWRFE